MLKHILGPDAVSPLDEGDDLTTHSDAVLAWFCDVRLSVQAGNALIQDCIVATQARSNIGQAGSPVTVWRDVTSGRFEVIGRADRVTEFQSVKSFTTVDLNIGFVKGHTDGGTKTPFHQYTQESKSVLTATVSGVTNAGLYRGVTFDGSGNPVTTYNKGGSMELVPFGELDFGTDPFGCKYRVTYSPSGTTRVKVGA